MQNHYTTASKLTILSVDFQYTMAMSRETGNHVGRDIYKGQRGQTLHIVLAI